MTKTERLRTLQNHSVEERLQMLEERAEDAWHDQLQAMAELLQAYDESRQPEANPTISQPLPQIADRRTFIDYVTLVAQKQHAGLMTGKEAGALLYAAQLVYAALKGGEVHELKPHAALP